MTTDKEFLIRVRADILQAVGELKKLPTELSNTAKAADKSAQSVDKAGKAIELLKNIATAYLSLRMVSGLIKQADAFHVLQTRVQTATRETGNYLATSKELYDITQRNGTALEKTVSLFQSLARSAPELGATTDQLLTLSDVVQQLGVISGASDAALSAGLLQFSQGLSSGVFRAEEFNSILENLPEVAVRIAKGMSITVGELRAGVLEGKVLSRDVFNALLSQAPEIGKQFKDIPLSVERSGNALKTTFVNVVAKIDEAIGATKTFASLMKSASDYMDKIVGQPASDTVLDRETAKGERLKDRLVEVQGDLSEALRGIRAGGLADEEGRILGVKVMPSVQELNDQIAAIESGLIAHNRFLNDLVKDKGREALGGAPEPKPKPVTDIAAATQAEKDFEDAVKGSEAAVKRENEEYQAWLNTLRSDGASVYDATRTSQEALANELARLDVLLNAGVISWDTYARAVFEAQDKTEGLSSKTEEAATKMSQYSIQAARAMEGAFAQGFFDIMDGNFKDLLTTFQRTIQRMIADIAAAKLLNAFLPSLGGGAAPVHKAAGGYITGPGTATSDSIPARLSAGEFVQPASSVSYYGADFMESIRQMKLPRYQFADGGIVSRISRPIAKFAEGGLATGGGDGGEVRVVVENRGSPKQASDTQVSMDGRSMVISIITDDVHRGGAAAAMLERTYGLRRGK